MFDMLFNLGLVYKMQAFVYTARCEWCYVQHETTKIQAEFSKIMTFLSLIAVDITYTECYGTLCPNFPGGYFDTQLS